MVVHARVAQIEALHVGRRGRQDRLRVLEDVAELGQLLQVVADQQQLVGGREERVGVEGRRLQRERLRARHGVPLPPRCALEPLH